MEQDILLQMALVSGSITLMANLHSKTDLYNKYGFVHKHTHTVIREAHHHAEADLMANKKKALVRHMRATVQP